MAIEGHSSRDHPVWKSTFLTVQKIGFGDRASIGAIVFRANPQMSEILPLAKSNRGTVHTYIQMHSHPCGSQCSSSFPHVLGICHVHGLILPMFLLRTLARSQLVCITEAKP